MAPNLMALGSWLLAPGPDTDMVRYDTVPYRTLLSNNALEHEYCYFNNILLCFSFFEKQYLGGLILLYTLHIAILSTSPPLLL